MAKRLIWADSLRGILIVLVVLGHAIQAQLGGGCFDNHVWNYIYSFHMAAFMAVSGWLSYRINRLPAINGGQIFAVWRRVHQLLIPFFMWSLLKLLTLKVSPSHEVFAVLHPDPYYWFLWALFWIQVFFIIGDRLSYIIKVKQEVAIVLVWILLALLMLVLNVRILGYQYIAYYYAFYTAGYYLHKYDGLLIKNFWALSFLTIIWGVLAWFWNMHELPEFLEVLQLPAGLLQYAYRLIIALIVVYVLICVSPTILNRDNFVNKPIIWMGTISLGVYGAHLLFIYPLTTFVRQNIVSTWTIIMVVFFLSVFISAAIVYMLRKWKGTARMLLGKV